MRFGKREAEAGDFGAKVKSLREMIRRGEVDPRAAEFAAFLKDPVAFACAGATIPDGLTFESLNKADSLLRIRDRYGNVIDSIRLDIAMIRGVVEEYGQEEDAAEATRAAQALYEAV